MKHSILIFIVLIASKLNAQWNIFSSGKQYTLEVSEANKKMALYRGLSCEVKLNSLKGKKLWLTSPNAIVKQGASSNIYTVFCDTSEVLLQIYYMKKNNWVFLTDVKVSCLELPELSELTIYGKEIQIGHDLSNFLTENYRLSTYDSLVYMQSYPVLSWSISFPFNKEFSGEGNLISSDVLNFIGLLPNGTSYTVRAFYSSDSEETWFSPSVSKTFTANNQEFPLAKYAVLNNTAQNKDFFDSKNPLSLVGLLNANYEIEPDLSKGILNSTITNQKNASFIGSKLISGINPSGYSNSGRFTTNQLLNPNLVGQKRGVTELDPTLNEKVLFVDGIIVPVFYKKGNQITNKQYFGNFAEILDTLTETIDPTEAELDPFGIPYQVVYRQEMLEFAYSTDSIDQIIIRYDSIINISNGQIEVVPSRISLAQFLNHSDTADIVFSIKYADLLFLNQRESKEFFAPTIHLKNDKSNASYFDLTKQTTLFGRLELLKNNLNSSNFPYLNYGNVSFFGNECELNGKTQNNLFELEKIIDAYKSEKIILIDGNAMNVYNKEGSSTESKYYSLGDKNLEILDEVSETLNPSEAALDEFGPIPVTYQIEQTTKKQFKGITDLFIKQQYIFDEQLKVNISRPTYLGFAQQMEGQTKPTLIMQIPLSEFPELLTKLPKTQPQLFLNQPWMLSIIQNNVLERGEIIIGSDIDKLQKKFHFQRNLISIDGEMELSSKPHF